MNEPISPPSYLVSSNLDVNDLGYYLDGWADLVVDKGAEADQIRRTLEQMLQERQMPQVSIVKASPSIKNETRKYNATTTYPGAATTIYVGEHGRDLYVSWRTFIKPVLNDRTVIIILGVSAVLGILIWLSTSFIWGFLVFLLVLAMAVSFVAFLGRLLKGTPLAYFFIEPNLFDAEDITAMGLTVHKMLLRALDKEGIDTSQLRLKQSFKGGRREEDI